MTSGQAIAHLQRMLAMKEARLANFKGANDSYLRADIAALRYALELADTEWARERVARAL